MIYRTNKQCKHLDTKYLLIIEFTPSTNFVPAGEGEIQSRAAKDIAGDGSGCCWDEIDLNRMPGMLELGRGGQALG